MVRLSYFSTRRPRTRAPAADHFSYLIRSQSTYTSVLVARARCVRRVLPLVANIYIYIYNTSRLPYSDDVELRGAFVTRLDGRVRTRKVRRFGFRRLCSGTNGETTIPAFVFCSDRLFSTFARSNRRRAAKRPTDRADRKPTGPFPTRNSDA